MKQHIGILVFLAMQPLLWAQSDSLRFIQYFQPADTLHFNAVYEGLYGHTPAVSRNVHTSIRKMGRELHLADSIPQHNLYLYLPGEPGNQSLKEFHLCLKLGDTAIVTSFKTELAAEFMAFDLVSNEGKPLIILNYTEYQNSNSGSTEMDVAALFMIDGFCLPLTRVIRKLWYSEHGNYEPACKDYQHISVEFSRNVDFRDNQLVLGRGNYKFSENLNCVTSSHSMEIPAVHYHVKDYLVLRR